MLMALFSQLGAGHGGSEGMKWPRRLLHLRSKDSQPHHVAIRTVVLTNGSNSGAAAMQGEVVRNDSGVFGCQSIHRPQATKQPTSNKSPHETIFSNYVAGSWLLEIHWWLRVKTKPTSLLTAKSAEGKN